MPTVVTHDSVINGFLAGIHPVRARIQRLILFGSRARGDCQLDSDYDILVVVAKKDDYLLDVLYEAVMDVLLLHGRLVSLKIYEEKEFSRLQAIHAPFIAQVMAEGVAIG